MLEGNCTSLGCMVKTDTDRKRDKTNSYFNSGEKKLPAHDVLGQQPIGTGNLVTRMLIVLVITCTKNRKIHVM